MARRWGRAVAFVILAETLFVALAWRFPLHRLYARVPPVDFAKLTGYRLWASGGLLVGYALLFGLLAGLVKAGLVGAEERARPSLSPRLVLAIAVLLALPLTFLYPIFAIDMLMYGVRSRLWLFHGANPFLVPPSAVPQEPWIGLCGEWIDATSGYSPLWEAVALIPGALAGAHRFLLHLFGLKVLALLAYVADGWLLLRLAQEVHPRTAAARLMLFAWNPLVLLELVGNGHNDGWMLAFMLLALWLAVRGRDVAAHGALAASVLVKVTPVFLWPLLWLWGVARRPTWRERARYSAIVALIVLATLALFALVLWPDPGRWQAVRESDAASRSPQTLFILLAMAARVPRAFARVQAACRVLFGLAYVAVLVWVWRRSRADAGGARPAPRAHFDVLVHGWLTVLALLILIFASNWRPWYTTWLLALAALSPSFTWIGAVFLLSFTAATGDVYWTNLRWRYSAYLPTLTAHLIGVPYVFGVPLAWAVIRAWRRRPAERPSHPHHGAEEA